MIITTYNSIEKFKDHNPDLLIVDEAHHTCVSSKSSGEESPFRSLLNFPAKRYLFMTATEKIIRQCSEDEEQPWYSMDSKFYGDEIYKKTFSDAIDEGIISDYRIVVVNSGDPVQIVYSSLVTLGIKWLLTYHNTCESAKEFQGKLHTVGIQAFYLDGDMSMNQRTLVLQAFENTRYSVLCSVSVLSEGISLPFVDSTYFVDVRNSEIDTIQRVGRCLRLHKDKSLATVILSENILDYVILLRSLVMYDPKTKTSMKGKLVGLNFRNDADKFALIETKIDVCIMGRLNALWDLKFRMCFKYEQDTNNTIKSNLKIGDIHLGDWINAQKEAIKGRGTHIMNEERLNQLLKLVTMQKWYQTKDDIKLTWDEKLALCHDYERLHGGTIIRSTTHLTVSIGSWVHDKYKAIQGHGGKMTVEQRIKFFELLTVQKWYKNLKEDGNWVTALEACIKYEKNNNLIGRTSRQDTTNCGYWLSSQKNGIKGVAKNIMNESRLEQLMDCRTFKTWYIANQNVCLPQFRGYHLRSAQASLIVTSSM